jgi:transmembrane sensor
MSGSTSDARSSIATEAADWYARLRAANVTELDAVRFRAWIASDPERRREFEAIDAFWDDLVAIETSPEVLRERAAIAKRRAQSPKPALAPSTTHRYKGFWMAAATVLIILSTVFWIRAQSADRYITGIGEQRIVPLADGSVVTLNTATEIRLHFSPTRRGVELVSGQANFEVAKDVNRPFVVTAGGSEVRAVGTQFDVYKTADKVTVTLIEGKVAVKEVQVESGAGSAEINLTAGEQLSYEVKTGAVKRASADIPRVSAWRGRKLDFSDTPLADAIAEANRYSHVQIELDAPELQSARISGTFEAGRNDLFVEGLQSYFRLHVEREGDRKIHLTAREDQSSTIAPL